MHTSKELGLHDEAVKVTWCACEICNATGPRSLTLVRNHHEYTFELNSRCCDAEHEDQLVSGETHRTNGHPSLRNQIPP
jgi:hypothetical protein